MASSNWLLGTRPWVNGQTLTSTGNRDLDGVIGGGVCLGTVTLVEEDRFSDHGLTLARYFLGQGAAIGHRCLVMGAEGRECLQDFVSTLPGSVEERRKAETSSTTTSDSRGAGSGLKIAWLYEKYISPSPSAPSLPTGGVPRPLLPSGGGGVSPVASYCLSFDLSSPPPQSRSEEVAVLDVRSLSRAGNYRAIYAALEGLIAGLPPGVVLRVVITSFLGAGGWDMGGISAPLHFLHSLRHFITGSPVVVMITMPAHQLSDRHRTLLYRVVDTVLAVDSFSGKSDPPPPEFREFVGFLHVKAVQHVNALAAARGASNKYGLKRDRRKLYIQPLHLPPEDARALTEDVEGTGKKKQPLARIASSAKPVLGCGSRRGGGEASLEF